MVFISVIIKEFKIGLSSNCVYDNSCRFPRIKSLCVHVVEIRSLYSGVIALSDILLTGGEPVARSKEETTNSVILF